MAIVNHNWLPQPQFARDTLKNYRDAPALPEADAFEFLQIGPNPGMPQGRQDVTSWYLGVTGTGQFNLYYHDGTQWVFSSTILTTQMSIDSIWFDFDQTGRAIVLINTGTEVWLNFPDASDVLTLTKIADGSQGSIVFDYPQNLRRQDSDLIVFYKNTNNQLAYRYQRDRYTIEYLIPGIEGEGLEVGRSSYTNDRRVQVRFSGLQFVDGICQPVATTPVESYDTERVRALQELPTGKILVGRSGTTTAITGFIGLADSLQDIADGNITNEVLTQGYADFAVLFSDSAKTIVATSNAVNDFVNGPPMEVIIYSIANAGGAITEVNRYTLLDGQGSLQGLAFGEGVLYALISLPASSRRIIFKYNVTDPATGAIDDGDFLIDNLEPIIGSNQNGFISLAYRNNTLFLCNSVFGQLYQIDLNLLTNNCTRQLTTESVGRNIGVNVAFNNDGTQLWSVQDIAPVIPVEVYNAVGGGSGVPTEYRYLFTSPATGQAPSRGQLVAVKRNVQGEVYALYWDGAIIVYPSLQDFMTNSNSLGSLTGVPPQDVVQAGPTKFWFITPIVNTPLSRYSYNPATHAITADSVTVAPVGNSVLPRGLAYDAETNILFLLSYQTKGQANTPIITAFQLDENGDVASQEEWLDLTEIDGAFNGSSLRGFAVADGKLLVAHRNNNNIYQYRISDKTRLDDGQTLTDTAGGATMYKVFLDEQTDTLFSVQQFQGNFAQYNYTLNPLGA